MLGPLLVSILHSPCSPSTAGRSQRRNLAGNSTHQTIRVRAVVGRGYQSPLKIHRGSTGRFFLGQDRQAQSNLLYVLRPRLTMIKLLKDLLQPQAVEDPQDEVRLAAASLLVSMAGADSEVDPAELDTIKHALRKLLGQSDRAIDGLIEEAQAQVDDSVSLYDFTKILQRQQTKEEKRDLIELLWTVACADGEIDPQEELLVRKVAGLLYVAQADFIAAKRAAITAFQNN